MHQQQRNRRRRHARNARGLAQGFRALLVEFLPHFDRQRADIEVIKTGRQGQVFIVFVTLDFLALALDVARIFELDFHLLAHGGVLHAGAGQGLAFHARHAHQRVVGDVRAAQQVRQRILALDGLADDAFRFGGRQDARIDPRGTQALQFQRHRFALGLERLPLGVADAAQGAADFRQAHVGIVFAQAQAVLGATGEHAVRFLHALGDQIVDQHAQIRLGAARYPGFLVLRQQGRIQARQHALRGRFLVAGGAVDLAGEEQARHGLRFQRGFQAARVKVIVFDGVAGAQDVGVFHALHRLHQGDLHVERQAGGDAVRVELMRRQAFRLEEDLVRFLACEAVDLVFDGRAIAGTHALDHARVHGTTVEAGADDVVRLAIRVRDPARYLARVHGRVAHDGKDGHGIEVARLFLHHGKVNRAAIDARRRARFQAALRQLQFLQAGGQRNGGRVAGAAGRVIIQAHVDLAVEESASRQHHGARQELQTDLRHGADDALAFDDQVIDRLLEQPQIRLVFQARTDGGLV